MKRNNVLLLILFLPCLALIILFGVPGLLPIADGVTARLCGETVPRLAAGGFLLVLLILKGYGAPFRFSVKLSHLIWALPCLAVAVVNFPFTALIGGNAVLDRVDLLWLFLLKCLSVALLEETFFRALLVPLLGGETTAKKLRAVLLSAALFGLMHLLNLFSGNVGGVLLQVGYTFLLGCMFAVMLLKTGNVYLCMLTHFLFDIGGLIVTDLGHGAFQDRTFWILTAVFGVLCAIHITVSFVRLCKKKIKFTK